MKKWRLFKVREFEVNDVVEAKKYYDMGPSELIEGIIKKFEVFKDGEYAELLMHDGQVRLVRTDDILRKIADRAEVENNEPIGKSKGKELAMSERLSMGTNGIEVIPEEDYTEYNSENDNSNVEDERPKPSEPPVTDEELDVIDEEDDDEADVTVEANRQYEAEKDDREIDTNSLLRENEALGHEMVKALRDNPVPKSIRLELALATLKATRNSIDVVIEMIEDMVGDK